MAVATEPIVDRPTAGAPRAVDLRDVVSVVDGFPLLTGIDLSVDAGTITLVSGANGAGKTSLLRLIAGILPVTSGRATVLGVDVTTDRMAQRRRVALVGHETGCYDDLTVRRNLALHARVAGVPQRRVAEVVEVLELDDLAATPHGRLSTGQRRRCALAVGLARDAELLLLDEPHAGLDAASRDVVDRAVLAAAARGATVLVVSHELDRARALAGHEVVLAGGCAIAAF